ncbi:MAG: cell wall-binding repeat-containing protein [Euzebya sp.]
MWTERQAVTGSLGTVVVLATLVLLAALLAVPPAGAQVEPGAVELERIDGGGQDPGDVRAVAIRTCQTALTAEGTAARVLIARDDAFADALAAAPLAGDDGCILFTGPGEQPLDTRVHDEIDRVRSPGGEVILLGGTEAVGQVVEDELTDAGYPVQRLAGTTRYETAVDIAEAVHQANSGSPFTEVILAYGENWPDSVTAGAYAAAQGVPIILTPTDVLHPAADAFLRSVPEVDRTTVVGGTAVIAEQTAAATPNPQRFAGDNRMGTATAIATALWPTAGMTGSDFVFVNLEAPDAWTLALAAAPLSALRGAPQLGVATDRVPAETDAYLADYGQSNQTKIAVLMGDESYIDAAVGDALVARMGGSATTASCDPASSQVGTEPPGEATRVEQVVSDLDGDDRPDRLTTYALADGQGGETFFLHVRLANDFAAQRELDADSTADVRPLGAAPIGEGRPVAFVVEQVGASTINVSLFGLHDFFDDPCALGRVTIGDHTVPPQFPIYSGNGLQCRDFDGDGAPELVVRQVSGNSPDASEFEWTEEAYTWPGGGALQFVDRTEGTFSSPEDDEEIQSFSNLDCPGVEAP